MTPSPSTVVAPIDPDTVWRALAECPRIEADVIEVTIVPGGVGLHGPVPDAFARNAAVRAVLRVPGVGGVADCLEIASPR
jgi:osmotically-inducible protein OsmY